MRPTEWRERGRTFEAAGRRLFFVEEGEGPPLLLLHAYPSASWGWHRLFGRLARRFRVVAPDLPGSGFSEKPRRASYSVFVLADQVEALARELGLERVHLLAHAYGSTTGQELLARAGEGRAGSLEIRSAAFVNGGLFPEGTRPILTQRLLLTRLGASLAPLAPFPRRLFERKVARTFGRPPAREDLEAMWQLLCANGGRAVAPRVLAYLAERIHHRARWVGALQRASVPLQLVAGTADPIAGQGVPRLWRELLPRSPLVELAGVGHYPPLEAPAALLEAWLAFMAESEGAL